MKLVKGSFLRCFSIASIIFQVFARPPPQNDDNDNQLSSSSSNNNELKYKIAIITDLDKFSKEFDENNQDTIWISNLKLGSLLYYPNDKLIKIKWSNTTIKLKSKNNFKNRGMELSELIKYNGHLLSFDDHTGIVYEIDLDKKDVTKWVTLMDADGKKPFKTEWASVKNDKLYVGSIGFEWVDQKTNKVLNYNPMYVNIIESKGKIENVSWFENYDAMRNASNLSFPGFIWHEAGIWSDIHRQWFFLPRKCSPELFNKNTEDKLGCNLLIRADENFKNIKVNHLNNLALTHGYSSFKFIPNTNDEIIVALSTREVGNEGMQSYISAFTIDGEILLEEEEVSSTEKYEGIEFI